MRSHSATHRYRRDRWQNGSLHVLTSQIPRQWRWHYGTLVALREPLLDDVRESLTAAAEPQESNGMHPADGASTESDRILALCLLSGEHDALHEVESAIRRILSGTYGTCEKTGERIPMERLRAIPWTRYTKEAQEALEKESATHQDMRGVTGDFHGPRKKSPR